jgi:hypothetical protein
MRSEAVKVVRSGKEVALYELFEALQNDGVDYREGEL